MDLQIECDGNFTVSTKVDTGAARTLFRFADFDKQLDDFEDIYKYLQTHNLNQDLEFLDLSFIASLNEQEIENAGGNRAVK